VTNRRPLVEAFQRVVARDAAAPLIVSSARSCSAGEISDLAAAVDERLRKQAVEPGDVVALMAPNGAGFVAGLLGLRRRGAAVLLIDHRTPLRES
jgi:acyl-CoA synthetase (AMP-forming)/AMP-acid ligase II